MCGRPACRPACRPAISSAMGLAPARKFLSDFPSRTPTTEVRDRGATPKSLAVCFLLRGCRLCSTLLHQSSPKPLALAADRWHLSALPRGRSVPRCDLPTRAPRKWLAGSRPRLLRERCFSPSFFLLLAQTENRMTDPSPP